MGLGKSCPGQGGLSNVCLPVAEGFSVYLPSCCGANHPEGTVQSQVEELGRSVEDGELLFDGQAPQSRTEKPDQDVRPWEWAGAE